MQYQKDTQEPQPQRYQKELEHLYARRSAIESVIQMLHDYDRLRNKRLKGTRKPV